METFLDLYMSVYEKYVEGWEESPKGTYFEDWTYHLSKTSMEEYDSEGSQGLHFQLMAEMETAARIQRAALLSKKHARFMVWLVEKGKEEFHGEFEEVLCVELSKEECPGVPVRDLPK